MVNNPTYTTEVLPDPANRLLGVYRDREILMKNPLLQLPFLTPIFHVSSHTYMCKKTMKYQLHANIIDWCAFSAVANRVICVLCLRKDLITVRAPMHPMTSFMSHPVAVCLFVVSQLKCKWFRIKDCNEENMWVVLSGNTILYTIPDMVCTGNNRRTLNQTITFHFSLNIIYYSGIARHVLVKYANLAILT
jgi:hypothetical protein